MTAPENHDTSNDHVDELADLASYLLGSLPPQERDMVRAHLTTCPVCQAELIDMAPLPALLNRSDPARGATMPPVPTPIALRERVVNQVLVARRHQRRTRVGALVALSLVAAMSLGGGVLLATAEQPNSPVTALQAQDFQQMTLTSSMAGWEYVAAVEDHAWGTSITIRAAGSPAKAVAAIVVVTADGTVERVGSWSGTGEATLTCQASTWRRLGNLRAVQVRDMRGQVVAELPLRA